MLTKARISNICVSLGPIATVPTLSSEKEEEYKKNHVNRYSTRKTKSVIINPFPLKRTKRTNH